MVNTLATGLDYSARRIPSSTIKAGGHSFVMRYLWFPGQRVSYIDASEYQSHKAAGLQVHLIYEQNTNDPAGGFSGGQAMARQAVQSAQAIGADPGTVIFMCADGWLQSHGISIDTAMAFLDGARPVIQAAGYRIGAYGFRDFAWTAGATDRAEVIWLCGQEPSQSEQDRNPVDFYQWNNGFVTVDGVTCDLNKQFTNIGGFLMALSDKQQAELYEWVRQLVTVAGHAYDAPTETTPESTLGHKIKDVASNFALPYVKNGPGNSTGDVVSRLEGTLKRIEEKQQAPGGVDTDALVAKINDDRDRRDRDGDPTTGQVS